MSDLILIHGFTGGPSSWDEVLAGLAGQQPVSCLTLVGHEPATDGGGDLEPSIFEEEVNRIASWIRSRGSGPVQLCGYSMGGRVSLGVALKAPDLIERLTLIGAHPGLPSDASSDRASRKEGEDVWIRMLKRDGIEAFTKTWESQPLFADQQHLSQEVQQLQRRQRLSHRPEGLARSLEVLGLSQMPCYEKDLDRLTMPVTYVVGERDKKYSIIGSRMVQAAPAATLVTVPEAGHNVVLERPRQVAAVLLRGELR